MDEDEKDIDVFEEEKPKRNTSKGPMSEKRRAQLLENLKRGRETSARNRKRRAEAKRVQKDIEEKEVQRLLNMKKNNEDVNSNLLDKINALENKLDEIAKRGEKKPEVKEVQAEVEAPKPEPLPMYSTFNILPF